MINICSLGGVCCATRRSRHSPESDHRGMRMNLRSLAVDRNCLGVLLLWPCLLLLASCVCYPDQTPYLTEYLEQGKSPKVIADRWREEIIGNRSRELDYPSTAATALISKGDLFGYSILQRQEMISLAIDLSEQIRSSVADSIENHVSRIAANGVGSTYASFDERLVQHLRQRVNKIVDSDVRAIWMSEIASADDIDWLKSMLDETASSTD